MLIKRFTNFYFIFVDFKIIPRIAFNTFENKTKIVLQDLIIYSKSYDTQQLFIWVSFVKTSMR